jgi:V/A-type H+-transporting ATPase subunit E
MTQDTTSEANGPEIGGVQGLIDQLKNDGVSQGRAEAERLVAEARSEAMATVDKAREEAAQIVANARQEAEQLERNGKEALKLAGRDATLQLKETLHQEFENRLGKLVGQSLGDPELIRQLIREIASATVPKSDASGSSESPKMQLLVSAGEDEQASKKLDELVRQVGGDMLAGGVELQLDGTPESGVRVRMLDQELEIELTETAVTKWLMRFLAPRFRSILDPSS